MIDYIKFNRKRMVCKVLDWIPIELKKVKCQITWVILDFFNWIVLSFHDMFLRIPNSRFHFYVAIFSIIDELNLGQIGWNIEFGIEIEFLQVIIFVHDQYVAK